jgi:alkylated DNA repair dioxygenase AlkB
MGPLSQQILPATPEGWAYATDFIGPDEELALLEQLARLPFQSAQYKEWQARRRIVSYGGRYDFSRNALDPAPPIPAFLQPLRERAAQWAALPVQRLSHAAVSEYSIGTPLGWHRDVHQFEHVIGISLLGHARMRFRPYPPLPPARTIFAIELAPRSIYLMHGAVRWRWQHAISPTRELRYSITFRSRTERAE